MTQVNQKALARHLELTDRRIRQLVEEHILPQPRDGKFDLSQCKERYRLYRGEDPSEVEAFRRRLEKAGTEVQDLINGDLDTVESVREALTASEQFFSDMRFEIAARSRSDAERDLFLHVYREKEAQAYVILLERGAELKGCTIDWTRWDDGDAAN